MLCYITRKSVKEVANIMYTGLPFSHIEQTKFALN